MRGNLLLLLLLLGTAAFSQNVDAPVIVYGEVITADSTVLNSAHIRDLAKNGNATVSDKDGNFSLVVSSIPAILEVSYVGYKTQAISIGNNDIEKGGKIYLSIIMELDSVSLPPALVKPEEKVETVFDPYKAYLFDYTFIDNQLLLLVSESGQRRLQLLDEFNNTVLKQNITHAVFEFKKDCLGNYHLLGEDSAYQVLWDVDLFVLYAGTLRKTLEEKLKPCLACNDETCILNRYKDHYQTEVFFRNNRSINTIDSIFSVTDKATKKFTETAYEEILIQAGYDPKRKPDVDLDRLTTSRQLQQEIWFYQKVLCKPIFCRVLPVNKQFYLFDNTNNELVSFDSKGNLGKQIKSNYDTKKKAGLKEIITNETQDKIFAIFIKGGTVTLDNIDLNTGDNITTYTLSEHRFPEKVKVSDNYAYYLYKDLGFDSKYKLFRQRLD